MPLSAKPYLQKLLLKDADAVDRAAYPFNIRALEDIEALAFHADVTFFTGENGSGKSTLLEAIAVALGYGIEGGTKNFRIAAPNPPSILHQHLRLSRSFAKPKDGFFLRAESLAAMANYLDEIGPDRALENRSLNSRSHGEATMALLLNKFRGHGLYLMDEPEAALSPNRQLAALSAIHQLVRDGSQFIIATHSPILLAYPNARIYQFGAEGIAEVAYEDTEHYAVTHDFLNHYPARLQRLLEED